MKQILLALVASVTLATGTSVLAATYTYTGNTYSFTSGIYTTAMSVSGEFTTAAPLADNLVGADISGLVLTFTFSDGINTITDANGSLAPLVTTPSVTVSTDGSGDIIAWSIFARNLPLATAVSETNDVIGTINSGMVGVIDQGGSDADCTAVDGVPNCTAYTPGVDGTGASLDNAGTWVTTLPPPPPTSSEPIPGLTGFGLALTGFGLLLLGMRRLHLRR